MDHEQHRAREIAGKWLAYLWVKQPPWLAKMPEVDDGTGLVDDIAAELRKARGRGCTPEEYLAATKGA